MVQVTNWTCNCGISGIGGASLSAHECEFTVGLRDYLKNQANLEAERDDLKRRVEALRKDYGELAVKSTKRISELERERAEALDFNDKFAEELKEFGTIQRLVEAYTENKRQCRDLQATVERLEKELAYVKAFWKSPTPSDRSA